MVATNLVTDAVDVIEQTTPNSNGLEKVAACPVQRMAVLPSGVPGVRVHDGARKAWVVSMRCLSIQSSTSINPFMLASSDRACWSYDCAATSLATH